MCDDLALDLPAPDARPVDVCVFEDDPDIREFITICLGEQNINVKACPLGWRAHLCIRENRPKVVILDVQVPAVGGIEMFYMVRGHETTAGIPVIFLTANPEKVRDELPNYEKMNAVVLPKPFRVQALLDLVQTKVEA